MDDTEDFPKKRGRPPGSATRPLQVGGTPLDAMLCEMRWWTAKAVELQQQGAPEKEIAEALRNARIAARDAAPFVHSKMSVTLSQQQTVPSAPVSADDARAKLSKILDGITKAN